MYTSPQVRQAHTTDLHHRRYKSFSGSSDHSALICYKCCDDFKILDKVESEAKALRMKLTMFVCNFSVVSSATRQTLLSSENELSRRRQPDHHTDSEDGCTPSNRS